MDINAEEDLTGQTTPVYEPPFMNKIIDKQLWLQYMKPQGDCFISVTRHESDGSIHIYCYSHDGEREWGAKTLVEVTSGGGIIVTAKQES